MTKPTDDSSFDDTLITITPQIMDVDIFPFFRQFTFKVADLQQFGTLFIHDLNILVVENDSDASYSQIATEFCQNKTFVTPNGATEF